MICLDEQLLSKEAGQLIAYIAEDLLIQIGCSKQW